MNYCLQIKFLRKSSIGLTIFLCIISCDKNIDYLKYSCKCQGRTTIIENNNTIIHDLEYNQTLLLSESIRNKKYDLYDNAKNKWMEIVIDDSLKIEKKSIISFPIGVYDSSSADGFFLRLIDSFILSTRSYGKNINSYSICNCQKE